jgi:tripartite-type tricarboxylate transporter receptor subunit TctC
MQEAGLPGYELGIWFGLFAPVRTPAAVVARLREALARTRTAQTEEQLRGAFVDPLAVPAEDLPHWIADSARWQQIAREARITAD